MKKLLIILDNGHGVNTKGKRSPDGKFREYKWAREFVEKLDARLKEEGFSTHILVPEDTDVSLSNRVLRANTVYRNFKRISSDWEILLISVHVDAAPGNDWSDARGLTVHICENASKKSKVFAQLVQTLANDDGLCGNRWLPKEMYFKNNYYILKNTNCPAVLVENCFMTNKEDVAFLESTEGKEKLLHVYLDAIKTYSLYIQG